MHKQSWSVKAHKAVKVPTNDCFQYLILNLCTDFNERPSLRNKWN